MSGGQAKIAHSGDAGINTIYLLKIVKRGRSVAALISVDKFGIGTGTLDKAVQSSRRQSLPVCTGAHLQGTAAGHSNFTDASRSLGHRKKSCRKKRKAQ